MSKAFISDRWAIDLLGLLNETGFADKLEELPSEIISMIECLNSLKQLFGELKCIPEEPITYNPKDPKERQVYIDDWYLEAFYKTFV